MFKTVAAESRDSHAWDMYAAERADIHAFLASLTPAQWNEPSLCEGWRVRDVAVHLLVDEPLEQLGVVRSLAKAATFKFSVHRINQWWITRNRERPTPEIAAAFGAPARSARCSARRQGSGQWSSTTRTCAGPSESCESCLKNAFVPHSTWS